MLFLFPKPSPRETGGVRQGSGGHSLGAVPAAPCPSREEGMSEGFHRKSHCAYQASEK